MILVLLHSAPLESYSDLAIVNKVMKQFFCMYFAILRQTKYKDYSLDSRFIIGSIRARHPKMGTHILRILD